MSLFRYVAYMAPLAVGAGVATSLALTRGRPLRRRIAGALGTMAAVLAVLAAAAPTATWRAWAQVALLAGGLAALVAGLFLLFESFRLPPELCQVIACLVVVLLMSTVFWFGPVLEHAERVGMSGDEISRRIFAALEVNPFMVMGMSIFEEDLLRTPALYPLDLASYLPPHMTPRWKAAATGYAVAGFALFALSLVVTALRLRLSG